jgi:hypothetical protein
MYRILDGSGNGIVGIRIESKLSREEYELLNSYLEQLMQEIEPINFLCNLAEGLDNQALWEEITCHIRTLPDYQRIAVVGEGGWVECGIKAGEPRLKTQLKYFPSEQLDEAWHWVKEQGTPN